MKQLENYKMAYISKCMFYLSFIYSVRVYSAPTISWAHCGVWTHQTCMIHGPCPQGRSQEVRQ